MASVGVMVDSDRFVVESPYVRRARRSDCKVRLICFPHAGAGASNYADWPSLLPPEVELIAVQLPGREDRITEKPLTQVSTVVRTVGLALRPYLRGSLAFFGHSGGALLAYELGRALQRRGGARLSHLFVSSQPAPDYPLAAEPLHALPDEQFLAAVRALGGTDESTFANQDLMRLLLPGLRADFALCENHRFEPGAPLDTPITAFGTEHDDRAPVDGLHAWRAHTTREFDTQLFTGDHFYLGGAAAEVTSAIADALLSGVPVN